MKPYYTFGYITLCTAQKRQSPHVCVWVRHHAAESVGQEDVGEVNCRVTCTWRLLSLALKGLWLVPGGLPLALTAWRGLQNTTLTLVSSKKACLGFERVYHKP